ncbi:hypothetical protein BHE74_00016910 [Ensete ventricosum]|nr:hypothetical protein BHE74_00016910 [Ensete ventricosum]
MGLRYSNRLVISLGAIMVRCVVFPLTETYQERSKRSKPARCLRVWLAKRLPRRSVNRAKQLRVPPDARALSQGEHAQMVVLPHPGWTLQQRRPACVGSGLPDEGACEGRVFSGSVHGGPTRGRVGAPLEPHWSSLTIESRVWSDDSSTTVYECGATPPSSEAVVWFNIRSVEKAAKSLIWGAPGRAGGDQTMPCRVLALAERVVREVLNAGGSAASIVARRYGGPSQGGESRGGPCLRDLSGS